MSDEAIVVIRKLSAWSGSVYLLMLFIGWGLLAGMVPPHMAFWNAEQVAALYVAGHYRIIAGMIVVMIAGLVVMPFCALITAHVSRIERGSGVLAGVCLLGSAATVMLTFYPALFWIVAAYRTDRAPELVQLMNDTAWLQYMGGISVFLAIPSAMMLCAFLDRSPTPTFPKWFGYLNVWFMLAILPDQILFLFTEGPFAWHGLFGFWIPVVAFFIWFFATSLLLNRACNVETAGSRTDQ